ncbi:MAG TPA: hypothetical protein VGF84_05765, partial [Micromonosporaceae bacterium]
AHAAGANGSYAAAGVFRVSADGRTLTTEILSPDRFDVRQDAHAVRIGEFDPPGLQCMFAGSCGSRTVTVTLDRPLGDRPLVNLRTGTNAGGPDLLRMTAPPAGYAHDYDTVLFGTDDPAHDIKSEPWAYEQHLTGPDGKTIIIVQSPEPLLDDRFAVGSVGGRDAYASDIGRAIEFQIGSTETVRIYGADRDYALLVQVANGLAAG